MKMTRVITNLAIAAAVAIPALTAAPALAEATPTVVVMHRNINNTVDEQNWSELALGLSEEGFRVVSVALERDEPANTASANLIQLLDRAGFRDKVLLVGTAAASDALSAVAQADPLRVKALVYISAADAVPAFGPRTVAEPASLLGIVPSYQVKVTNDKHTSASAEGGQMVFKVREEGHSTLARTHDVVTTISQVNELAKKTPVAPIALGTK